MQTESTNKVDVDIPLLEDPDSLGMLLFYYVLIVNIMFWNIFSEYFLPPWIKVLLQGQQPAGQWQLL